MKYIRRKSQNTKQIRSQLPDKLLSINKQVLLGLFELVKDLGNVMIDPYGTYNQSMGTKPGKYEYLKEKTKPQLYTAINYLQKQGLVKKHIKEGRTIYELTELGQREAHKQIILGKLKTKKVDGKWRIVIFDIPEDQRRLRDNFRNLLKEFGFKKLQASVWASPYDIFDDLESLIPDIKKHDWIKLLLVDVIVGENDFNRMFR